MDEHPEHPTLSWNLYGKALPQVYPSNQYNINCVFLMLKLDRCTTELTAHYHMAELPSFAISLLALFLTIRQQVTSKQCAMHMMAVLSQEHTMASFLVAWLMDNGQCDKKGHWDLVNFRTQKKLRIAARELLKSSRSGRALLAIEDPRLGGEEEEPEFVK
jgi:hypothetical protein